MLLGIEVSPKHTRAPTKRPELTNRGSHGLAELLILFGCAVGDAVH